MKKAAIIIPAYEPDGRLIELLTRLDNLNLGPVFIVNDGSSSEYDHIFEQAGRIINRLDGRMLKHEINKGKGRALKTAFREIIENYSEVEAVVTADSDGQHTPESIRKIMERVIYEPESLVLGVRDFDVEGIPWKSKVGNKLTAKIFQYITGGVNIVDTQTGLRGIPRSLMKDFINVIGERFEFEMRMLLEAADKYNIIQVTIDTVYDSKEAHQTHFKPVNDSIKIYKILGERFIKYIFSSCSSGIIDLALFYILSSVLKTAYPMGYAAVATVLARSVSAIYNYFINYKIVFKSQSGYLSSGGGYVILAFFQMWISAILITLIVHIFPYGEEVAFKILIDTALFFVSYYIQKRVIFSRKKS